MVERGTSTTGRGFGILLVAAALLVPSMVLAGTLEPVSTPANDETPTWMRMRTCEETGQRLFEGCPVWFQAGKDLPQAGSADIAVSKDGSTVATVSASARTLGTVAYDASTGERAWDRSGSCDCDVPRVQILDSQASVIASSGEVFSERDALGVHAYDLETGETVWEAGSSALDAPRSLITMEASRSQGMVLLAGTVGGHEGSQDLAAVGLDARTGQEVWTWPAAGTSAFDGWDAGIWVSTALSADGRTLFIGGSADDGTDTQMLGVALDAADGQLRWATLAGDAEPQSANAVAVGPEGDPILAGERWKADGDHDPEVRRLDGETGDSVWTMSEILPDQTVRPVAVHPGAGPEDRVLVAGNQAGATATGWNVSIRSLDAASGVQEARQLHEGPGGGKAFLADSVLVDDGRCLLVLADTSSGLWTAALDASSLEVIGDRLYDAWGDEEPHGLTVSPDESMVYVTGSRGQDEQPVTMAYENPCLDG